MILAFRNVLFQSFSNIKSSRKGPFSYEFISPVAVARIDMRLIFSTPRDVKLITQLNSLRNLTTCIIVATAWLGCWLVSEAPKYSIIGTSSY